MTLEDLHQYSSSIYGEEDFVRLCKSIFLPFREVHGRRVVYDQMAAKVGLLLVLLDEQLVGAGVQFPVNVADGLAGVVGPVLGKFYGETVHRALVNARDEAFQEIKVKCGQYQIDVIPADITQGFEQILLPYLLKRSQMY